MGATGKLLIVQVAGLGHDFARTAVEAPGGLTFRPTQSVFPAVTCAVQAGFRTASLPDRHGMIANGRFWRDLRRVMFWEQSAALVAGQRIWSNFRRRGGTVGLLFWQQSLGEDADVILSPAPIHKHHGGMIQDCYAQPPGLYERLCRAVGRPFRLRHYWGPLASPKAGDWIAAATAALLRSDPAAPDLCLTYLPTLDYDLQRFGPDHARARAAGAALARQLAQLAEAARQSGRDLLVFGDCAIGAVSRAAFPNRALASAGLLATRNVRGMLYPDFHASRAFAMVDHEIGHVYVRDAADVDRARTALDAAEDVAEVVDRTRCADLAMNHPNSGELILVAEEGAWLAYPWWESKRQAPDYASHVDIHNKPGYDPCELFFGWSPMSVSQDTAKLGGSHGRIGRGREVAWAATFLHDAQPDRLIDLAALIRDHLEADRA